MHYLMRANGAEANGGKRRQTEANGGKRRQTEVNGGRTDTEAGEWRLPVSQPSQIAPSCPSARNMPRLSLARATTI